MNGSEVERGETGKGQIEIDGLVQEGFGRGGGRGCDGMMNDGLICTTRRLLIK